MLPESSREALLRSGHPGRRADRPRQGSAATSRHGSQCSHSAHQPRWYATSSRGRASRRPVAVEHRSAMTYPRGTPGKRRRAAARPLVVANRTCYRPNPRERWSGRPYAARFGRSCMGGMLGSDGSGRPPRLKHARLRGSGRPVLPRMPGRNTVPRCAYQSNGAYPTGTPVGCDRDAGREWPGAGRSCRELVRAHADRRPGPVRAAHAHDGRAAAQPRVAHCAVETMPVGASSATASAADHKATRREERRGRPATCGRRHDVTDHGLLPRRDRGERHGAVARVLPGPLGMEVHFDITVDAVDYVRSLMGIEMRDCRVVYLRVPGSDGIFVELLEYHGTDARPTPDPRSWDPGTGHLCFHVSDAQGLLQDGRSRPGIARARRRAADPGRAQQGRLGRLSHRSRRLSHRAVPASARTDRTRRDMT